MKNIPLKQILESIRIAEAVNADSLFYMKGGKKVEGMNPKLKGNSKRLVGD